jgi:type VI secretion system protein ImpF
MAELSLRERLQPALLDRLVDDERVLTVYELTVEREAMRRLGISAKELSDIVCAQGLEVSGAELEGRRNSTDSTLYLYFHAAGGRVGVSRLKSLWIKPPGAPDGIRLESFLQIDARNIVNSASEPAERRYIAARRLRECVCRDLAILLNSTSLDASIDLSAMPHVQRSVLNYGMPSLAGRASASVDLRKIARTVEEVIRQFEPRLVQVRVTPETDRDSGDDHEIFLRIDAELWGQPVPQHLVLRTRISTESGDVAVTDSGAG